MQFKKIQVIFSLLACTLVWSSPIVDEKTNSNGLNATIDNTNNKVAEPTNEHVVVNKKKCIVKPKKDNITKPVEKEDDEDLKIIKPTNKFQYITDENFIVTEFRGDYGLDQFLENGGGDENLQLDYVFNLFGYNLTEIMEPYIKKLMENELACSAMFVQNDKGGYYFGRVYDMIPTKLLVLVNHPDHGYSSISSSDINSIAQTGVFTNEEMYKLYSIVIPVDGINEKGLSISLHALPFTDPNTQQNDEGKSQNISYINSVRLILDKAATVDDAIELLKSRNYINTIQNVHYLISDTTGKSVAVEYYNNTMYVTETPVMTNYYVSEDIEVGHNSVYEVDTRFDDLMKLYKQKPIKNFTELKDSMYAAIQNNTAGGENTVNTEWTVIHDSLNLEATYYRKFDFQHGYRIKLESEKPSENRPVEN